MRRDVDLARLRGLPGRRVISGKPGEQILRQGEPAGDLLVVISGQIRLTREGADLARVGPAEAFGEVAALAGGGHPYDAFAETTTTILAVPAASLEAALAQGGVLARGLAQTIADRAMQLASAEDAPEAAAKSTAAAPAAASSPGGLPPSLLEGAGLDLPPPPWEVAQHAAEEKQTVDRSIPRPEAFWQRATRCPICSHGFGAMQVRDTFVEVVSRDSDLYEHHAAISPLYYGIPVCPECLYAAFPDDFNRVTAPEQEAVRRALEPLRPRLAGVDFRGYRDAAQARASFELAILCYGARRPQYRKVAGLYHRLAWLARTAGSGDLERAHLATARAGYTSALEKGEIDEARTELLLTYLVGELSRRLDDLPEATRWASMALQHPQIERHKSIAEMARDLRQAIRAARAAES